MSNILAFSKQIILLRVFRERVDEREPYILVGSLKMQSLFLMYVMLVHLDVHPDESSLPQSIVY